MTVSKSKTTTIAISVIMMLTMAISIVAIPSANAQGSQKTYPFIDATPNPVGVGEQCLIRIGISQLLGLVDQGWEGLIVEVETPGGDAETLDNGGDGYRTDSTGGTAFVHVFEEVGTYRIRLHFPEQEVQTSFYDYERGGVLIPAGKVMEESYTDWIDVVVTEEPNPSYPDQPLPAEYWTRPIDPQLRIWSVVAGNWRNRERNSVALYNDDAPETAHVLWAKELTTGGLTGGLWTDVPASSETGDAYEGKFSSSIVMNGILYYQRTDPSTTSATIGVDLHTGEEVFYMEGQTYAFGQILYFNSWNYDGVFTYLWDTSGEVADDPLTPEDESHNYWDAYDPFTGNRQMGFANVPDGIQFWGPSGEILILEIDLTNRWMALWNSTAAGFEHLGAMSSDFGSWGNTVHGAGRSSIFWDSNQVGPDNAYWNASLPDCYSWNVTLDGDYAVQTSFRASTAAVYLAEERFVGMWYNQSGVRVWSVDFDGDEQFDEWWDAPDEWEDGFNTLHYGGASDDFENGIIFMWNKENRQHYAFSVEDGEYMWVTESEHYLDWYGWGNAEHTWYIYEDHLYSTGVGGIVYAYNLTTGETDWTYYLEDAYNEPVTGLRWWGWITLIADGKVYVGTCEHSAEQPLPRGAPLVCLNATSGEEIWRVNGMYRATRWGGNAVMGDSIYATMDTYDQRIYAVGKGPSATTVSAAPKVSAEGDSVIVEGMVTDISPGTAEYALTARFPDGVPAVCDDNMSEWMLYVYKQFVKPADVVGVDVTVTVLDPNGNSYEVGTVTSDENGFYQLMFEPPVPGEYTVYATFCGSDAYWGSSATTALGVLAAPEPTAPPTEPPADPTGTYVTGFGIGIIIVVVVIGLVIILMLRKR